MAAILARASGCFVSSWACCSTDSPCGFKFKCFMFAMSCALDRCGTLSWKLMGLSSIAANGSTPHFTPTWASTAFRSTAEHTPTSTVWNGRIALHTVPASCRTLTSCFEVECAFPPDAAALPPQNGTNAALFHPPRTPPPLALPCCRCCSCCCCREALSAPGTVACVPVCGRRSSLLLLLLLLVLAATSLLAASTLACGRCRLCLCFCRRRYHRSLLRPPSSASRVQIHQQHRSRGRRGRVLTADFITTLFVVVVLSSFTSWHR
mmetsp:Transcript_27622/g.56692  ORF Transcript_27622/g.56692 Transcript_27622/m.56692 type:complete len:264 (+) Transcript_27622:1273-2064(+)